jgi:hypothetical protein
MTAFANTHHSAALLRAHVPFAVFVLALASPAHAGASENPFLPPAASAAATASPSENLEFAGINVMSEKTFVVVHDKQLKKSRWIAVGESQGGIAVLAYDPRREQIVVKSGEIQKTLTLRKSAGTSGVGAPAPVPVMAPAAGFAAAPPPISFEKIQPPPPSSPVGPIAAALPAPAPAPTPSPVADQKPQTIQRQEEEARMLVSDLLEIGMAQRKAYEDAQKKAAGQSTEQPAPAPSGP